MLGLFGLICGFLCLLIGGVNLIFIDKEKNKKRYLINLISVLIGSLGILGNLYLLIN